MKFFRLLLLIALSVLFVESCNNESKQMEVETDDVVIEKVKIDRLEQDVFTLDTSNIESSDKKLQQKYGNFYSSYVNRILNNGGIKDASHYNMMKRFISDKDMKEVYSDCQKKYPDVKFLEEEMEDLFKHYKYHFPKKNIPRVITMISGFNYSNIYLDSTLSVGLELYLGSDNKFYKMLALPNYKTMFTNKENIVSDAFRTWMFEEFPYNMNKNDFLSEIVYIGKIMYLHDAMLPELNDTIKIQYTQKQLDYCLQNEFNVWSYFIAQKVLYTTNRTEMLKFTNDGPFTSALSKEAPARIGYWIGWQIVRQYMKNNPDITHEQLMKENDAQTILSKSKYKPKK